MNTKSGFSLIELLIALFISTLMIMALSIVLISGLRAGERAKANFSKYQTLRVLILTMEKELRNTLVYPSLPFRGKEDWFEFPSYTLSHGISGGEKKLLKIKYFLKGDKLIRAEENMKENFRKKDSEERAVLSGIKSIHFEYPYAGHTKDSRFLPFWLDEPYQGIPKAVEIRVELVSGASLTKMISIPQGRIGALPEGESQ
ncbi:MAG: hypothetical protein A2036_04315 [Omnitrophica bacterium GWA2_50_21]|nr:MAG: hypothetical protein A2036_04315 [Omnitrophica bacterium GWA2_50_21]